MARIKDRSPQAPKIKPRNPPPEPEDTDSKPPVFSFEFLQPGWCIQDCQQEERSKMLDKLRRLSRLSWQEIRQQSRHALGTEKIAQGSIKAALPGFLTADVNLIAFRAYDKVAMVGYKNGRIFHVIWIDRAFNLYNHG